MITHKKHDSNELTMNAEYYGLKNDHVDKKEMGRFYVYWINDFYGTGNVKLINFLAINVIKSVTLN